MESGMFDPPEKDDLEQILSKGRRSIMSLGYALELTIRATTCQQLIFRNTFTKDIGVLSVHQQCESTTVNNNNVNIDNEVAMELIRAESQLWKRKFEQVVNEMKVMESNHKNLLKDLNFLQRELTVLRSTTTPSTGDDASSKNTKTIDQAVIDTIVIERSSLRSMISNLPQVLQTHLTESYIPRSVYESKQYELNVSYLRLLSSRVKERSLQLLSTFKDTMIMSRKRPYSEVISNDRLIAANAPSFGNNDVQSLKAMISSEKSLMTALSSALMTSEEANHELLEALKSNHTSFASRKEEQKTEVVVGTISQPVEQLHAIDTCNPHRETTLTAVDINKNSNVCTVCRKPSFGIMLTCIRCKASLHITCCSNQRVNFQTTSSFSCDRCSNP